MEKRPLLLGLIVFALWPLHASAKDKAKDLPLITEQTTKLDPMEVKTSPFANWGIGIHGRLSLWNKISGGPPKVLFVTGVALGSPANIAGVQMGDEITAVDGVVASELRWSELDQRYSNTESGEVIALELFNHATKQKRMAELKIRSNRTWGRQEGVVDLNCWGLRVLFMAPKLVHATSFPNQRRILRWETVQTFDSAKPKKKQIKIEQKPVYITRRAAVFTWGDQGLTLIERENHLVEVIEAAKVAESDDLAGRLVGEGATLTLNADGSYELKDVPSETEPTKMPPTPAVETQPSVKSGETGELPPLVVPETAPSSGAASMQPR